ncbi:MAG: hypothetical protein EP344_15050 [Bacteroidetes bacterium]|nr:MAG: hypothetical protein EP344_15050 [Bacteroidota bacterium]
MANIQSTPDGVAIEFKRNKGFLGPNSSSGVVFAVNNAPDVLLALNKNQPFPNRVINLSELKAKAKADQDIRFGKGKGQVRFNGKASAYSGFGVFPDAARLFQSIGLDDDIAPGVSVNADPASNYLLLRWGYDFQAAGEGGIVFGTAGSAKFGMDAKSEGIMAVIRQLPKTMGAASAIAETVDSWLMPLQVDSADALPPGTWIIAEADSMIGVGLNAQFGYDFNWVKEAQAAGLTGDIGLRLQVGAKVALGFQAGGRFAVVVSRESVQTKDQQIRIRLFKQRKKGWNFAMNSQVSVQGDVSDFLPENFNEFVKAVFGVHSAQLLKDLAVIEKWTDPNQDISELITGVSTEYFVKFVQDATGIDPRKKFKEAKAQLQDFLTKWHNLDHNVATMIWKQIDNKVDLKKIRDLNEQLQDADGEKVRNIIQEKIADIEFFRTPEGQFLLALLPDEQLISIFTDSKAFQQLQNTAKKVSTVLDGGVVMETLVKLQQQLNDRLNLDKIEKRINEAEFEDLDEWLKAKLSDFLDEKLKYSKVEDVRKTIHLILSKREVFYQKGLRALNQQYVFGFNAAFQKNTNSQALIDITLDAKKGDIGPFIRLALAGQFDKILTKPHPAVKLNVGSLTHSVNLNSRVELNLPYFGGSKTHINSCLADMKALDEEDGRVFLYDLKAKDVVLNKQSRMSALSVGGHMRVGSNQVNVHDTSALTFAYSFQQLRKDMKRADLQYQIKPYIETYLPSTFSATQNGTTSASIDTWISDLDKEIDQLEPNGTDNFGNTLLYLGLTLPSNIASAWLQAPRNKRDDAYMLMSKNLQARLKQLIPFYYFQDPQNYKNQLPAAALLAYASIPASTSIQLSSSRDPRVSDLNTNRDVYWDWNNSRQVQAMLLNPHTIGRLSARLQQVYNRLKATPGLEREADFYNPERVSRFLADVISDYNRGKNDMHFHNLFYVEAAVIRGAYEAGRDMAKFIKKSKDQPTKAVRILTDFGTNITRAFNEKLETVYGGGALRPFGTMMFLEAASAFLDQKAQVKPSALLDLTVLSENAQVKLTPRIDLNDIPHKDILVQKRLVELGDKD